MAKSRDKLLSQLESARAATSAAIAKEQRLIKQLALVDKRIGDAVEMEERSIREQEAEEMALETFVPMPFDDRLSMSPSSWASLIGVDSGEASAS